MQTHLVVNSILNIAYFKRKMYMREHRLQKLLYLACAWHVAEHNEWLISSCFKAFHYGPTEPSTLYCFRKHNGNPIEHEYMYENYIVKRKTHPVVYDTLNFVFDLYANVEIEALASITNHKSGPWFKVYKKEVGGVISRESVRDWYRKMLEKGEFYV